MSIRVEGTRIILDGDCGVEDAEPLAAALEAMPSATVDISPCRQLHSAVVQALLVFRPYIEGVPSDPFLNAFVLPSLAKSVEPQPVSPARLP
ncbi:MAG: hypothetical protein Q7T61_08925 [Caulobacter sp.]|nr:hypothetical protein [Caulobacter sp.]